MAIVVNADYLLAMLLQTRDSVSYDDLSRLQQLIEAACPDVVVDLSSPTIRAALQYYPEIFERKGNRIARAKKASEYLVPDYLDAKFRRAVPMSVNQAVTGAIACQ